MIFFCFITSLTIYVHLITISHLTQFPSVVWLSLYLFIYWFFFSAYLFRELTSGGYEPPLHLWFMWFSGGCSHHCIVKCLFYQASWGPDMPSCGPLAVAPTGRMLARYSWNGSAVWYDSTVLAPQEEAAQIPTPVRELDEYHHPAPNIQHTSCSIHLSVCPSIHPFVQLLEMEPALYL